MTTKDLIHVTAVAAAIMAAFLLTGTGLALAGMWLLFHAHPLLPVVTVLVVLGVAAMG